MPHEAAKQSARVSKGDATRQRILDAAARLFRERGYSAVRLIDIADAAKLQKASLYFHFSSREEIVEHVLNTGVERVFDAVRARVLALPSNATWRARIEAGMQEHLRLALLQDDYTSANVRIYAHVPASVQKRHSALRQRYGGYWRKLVAGAAEAGELRADLDASIIRMFMLGSVTWSVEWYRPGGRLSLEEIARQLTSILFDGAAAR
ncbi:MAG: TetR/AcrR family transcriptional regulator [Hyphomonadaceae bacterium]